MRHNDSDIFDALSNPIRREIILLLGEHGSLRAKQLKEFLNIGPGQLYYHLSLLRELISQNENKEYVLTKVGRDVYRAIARGEAPQPPESLSPSSLNPMVRIFSYLLFPKFLFNYIFESPSRHLFEVILIIILGGYLSFESGYITLILIPIETVTSLFYSYLYLLLTILIIYLVIEASSIILFRRVGGHLNLFIGVALSIFPMILFYLFIYVDELVGFGLMNIFSSWLVRLIMIVCQLYTITFLASCISVAKSLRIDKASLISLIIAYLSIVLYLLL